ncbi:MAG: YigZ family protein [Lachnospiraceae bacterium]|nr:YigZ family protein [Lachnospiraceae bacterium]
MGTYQCLKEGGVGEIKEKKSRFIATLRPVTTEEEATAFINETKKKYWDAKHNCSAFVIGRNSELTRCSDDGEPAGTAGRPMLEVLTGAGLTDVCVVVTRYFGGVLLGTGGLIRAYQAAVKEGLANAKIVKRMPGTVYSVQADYSNAGRLQNLFGREEVIVSDSSYGADVIFTIVLLPETEEATLKKIADATDGVAVVSKQGETEVEVPVRTPK